MMVEWWIMEWWIMEWGIMEWWDSGRVVVERWLMVDDYLEAE